MYSYNLFTNCLHKLLKLAITLIKLYRGVYSRVHLFDLGEIRRLVFCN